MSTEILHTFQEALRTGLQQLQIDLMEVRSRIGRMETEIARKADREEVLQSLLQRTSQQRQLQQKWEIMLNQIRQDIQRPIPVLPLSDPSKDDSRLNSLEIRQEALQQLVHKKNKTTVSISNQLCQRLQKVDRQIVRLQQKFKENRPVSKKTSTVSNEFYHGFKIRNLSEVLKELQQQLHEKAFLKDIGELVRNTTNNFEESLTTLRGELESGISGTNRILHHQTVINEQLCRQMRIGRWQWLGHEPINLELVPWEKEAVNLYPEGMLWSKNTSTIVLKQPGWYELTCSIHNGDGYISLILNDQEVSEQSCQYLHITLKVDKNSNLSVGYAGKPTCAVLSIRKL